MSEYRFLVIEEARDLSPPSPPPKESLDYIGLLSEACPRNHYPAY